MRRLQRAYLAVSFTIISALPAVADQIDGDWCNADGRHLSIKGPSITIPSGAQIIGQYGHHSFAYTGPADDPEAGQEIRMVQQSEALMYLNRSNSDVREKWNRCQLTS